MASAGRKRRTISATAGAFRSSTAKPGTTAAAARRTAAPFTRSDGLRSSERILLRHLQRRNRALLLARHAKRRAAAHHDPQSARGRKRLRHHRRGRRQVPEVLQDEQELAILQIAGQVLHQRRPPGIRRPDALGVDDGTVPIPDRRRRRNTRHRDNRPPPPQRVNARRVLPLPPGPVGVEQQTAIASRLASASSRSWDELVDEPPPAPEEPRPGSRAGGSLQGGTVEASDV